MNERRSLLLSWSGGKDCALALREILAAGTFEIAALLATVSEQDRRSSMHRVREPLLRAQAASLGLPLDLVPLPDPCPNDVYEERMRRAMERHLAAGVQRVAFGDLYLEDVRRYREAQLARLGMEAIFPLWRRDSRELARNLVASGFRAVVVCVDTRVLPASFVGREIDPAFLADLPAGVDPCGENGEFHTFVHAGPIFREPILVRVGETTLRDGRFADCDLLPSG